jgi:DNA-binding LacI/PurR family transcriptional regulator
MLSPRPASIDLGAEDVGRRAVTRLLNRVAHPNEPSLRMLVSPSLAAAAAAAPVESKHVTTFEC